MNDLKFTTASDYMNAGTKFEDLMYRAGLTAQGCWDEMDEYDRKAIEKFAELIVKECAHKVDWIFAEGGKTQGDLIKEHFGVEE
jgi:hypothetical protein